MNTRHLVRICGIICISTMASVLTGGCIREDFAECKNTYDLRLVFDRNMLYTDAFASQVRSVDVKVFDSSTGREVYSYADSGAALESADYRVALPIPPGTYDILCWAGMAEGDSFGHALPAADMLQQHSVTLNTENGVSGRRLNNLYHGLSRGVTFVSGNSLGHDQAQTTSVYLTKNTNRVCVMLHNLDGTELDESGFTFSITSGNALMNFDNTLDPAGRVTYRPWHVTPIMLESETKNETKSETKSETVQSALAAEISMARLVPDGNSRLDVYRTADGERIISVPLERNLLLYKGEYHSMMSDAEYLDRQDDYTITFILDRNNNWDRAAMIYINNWATPPVQYQDW